MTLPSLGAPQDRPERIPPITGRLVLDGWEGRTEQVVEIVGQTPKRLRIRALTTTRLAGRRRLSPGDTALVPTYAVRDNCEACHGARHGVPGNENRVNGRLLCDYCAQDVAVPARAHQEETKDENDEKSVSRVDGERLSEGQELPQKTSTGDK